MKVGGGRGRGGMRPFNMGGRGSGGMQPFTWPLVPSYLSSSSLFLHICSILGFHNQA